MPTTSGMKGGGYYNAHSNEQRAVLDAFLPWIEDALVDLPLPSTGSPPLGLLDTAEDDLLPRKIYQDLIYPVYFRTHAELTAPIESDTDLAACLRIEKAGDRKVPAPFNLECGKTGDAAVWARSYAGFLRAVTEPILAAAIPTALSESGIAQDIYRRVEERLVADPTAMNFIISPWGHCLQGFKIRGICRPSQICVVPVAGCKE